MECSSFLEKKYRSYFKFLDISKTGFITQETFHIICTNLCEEYKAKPEAEAMLIRETQKWWLGYQELAENGQVSEEKYVDGCKLLLSQPDSLSWYRENVKQASCIIFDIIDFNQDGSISIAELWKYYRAFGCQDERFVREVFQTLDIDGNGCISKAEFLDIFDKYFFSNDPNTGCKYLFDWSVHND